MILYNLVNPWTIYPLKQSGVKLAVKLNKSCEEAINVRLFLGKWFTVHPN